MVFYREQNSKKTVYFAPYLLSTHSCYTHADTCLGELVDTSFLYEIHSIDEKINLNGSIATESDGFFELSVSSRDEYTISVTTTLNGTVYKASTSFSSSVNSADCITTLKLLQINSTIAY